LIARDNMPGEWYRLLLAQTEKQRYCLVTIDGRGKGNRWSDPAVCTDTIGGVTARELVELAKGLNLIDENGKVVDGYLE